MVIDGIYMYFLIFSSPSIHALLLLCCFIWNWVTNPKNIKRKIHSVCIVQGSRGTMTMRMSWPEFWLQGVWETESCGIGKLHEGFPLKTRVHSKTGSYWVWHSPHPSKWEQVEALNYRKPGGHSCLANRREAREFGLHGVVEGFHWSWWHLQG